MSMVKFMEAPKLVLKLFKVPISKTEKSLKMSENYTQTLTGYALHIYRQY